MRHLPYIAELAYVPRKFLSAPALASLQDELTIKVVLKGSEGRYGSGDDEDENTVHVRAYRLTKTHIGVPRTFGLARFGHLSFVNRTVDGVDMSAIYERFCTIEPRTPEQADFMRSVADVCTLSDPCADVLANAKTGSGKTVSDLKVTAEIGVPTLVIVPRNTLKLQWQGSHEHKNGIRFFFGDEFVRKYVGFVQQDVCDYKGKLIVIGMMQSLARRDYGRDFYRYFGKVTFDEVHKCPAPVMSEVLMKFPARIRCAYTATNRRDALKKMCSWHFGPPKVVSKQRVLRPVVYVHKRTYWHPGLNIDNEYTRISALCSIGWRNEYISNLVAEKYAEGRTILVLSDRIEQLQTIEEILLRRLPAGEIGLYAGKRYTGRIVLRVKSLDGESRYVRVGVYESRHDAYRAAQEYPNERFDRKFDAEQLKIKQDELDRIARECRVFLATYGIFDLGTDIARIDTGVEASPRFNVTQPVGRVLRVMKDKKQPEWHSFYDEVVCPSESPFNPEYRIDWFDDAANARDRCFKEQDGMIRDVRVTV